MITHVRHADVCVKVQTHEYDAQDVAGLHRARVRRLILDLREGVAHTFCWQRPDGRYVRTTLISGEIFRSYPKPLTKKDAAECGLDYIPEMVVDHQGAQTQAARKRASRARSQAARSTTLAIT